MTGRCEACGKSSSMTSKDAVSKCKKCGKEYHNGCVKVIQSDENWLCPLCKLVTGDDSETKNPEQPAWISSLLAGIASQNATNLATVIETIKKQPAITTQPTTTPTISNETTAHLAKLVQQQAIVDLPVFDGNGKDWPRFKKLYDETAAQGGFTDVQNMNRLEKALTGYAKIVASPYFLNPSAIKELIEKLEETFGNALVIQRSLVKDILACKSPKDGSPKLLIPFSAKIETMVVSLKSINKPEYLNDFRLLDDLVRRLPPSLEREWIAKTIDNNQVNLEDFSNWLKKHARVAGLMSTREEHPKAVNVHQEASSDTGHFCFLCRQKGHSLGDCKKFDAMNINSRWKKVSELKLCLGCLATKRHRLRDCSEAKQCGINGCNYKHHTKLHNPNFKPNFPATSSNSANSQPSTSKFQDKESDQKPKGSKPDGGESSTVGTSTNGSSVFYQILPVTLYGHGTQIDTYCYLDTGSALTLLDEEIASQLRLNGTPQSLCMKWTGDVTSVEENSLNVSLRISARDGRRKFWMRNVRTVGGLSLPVQSVDADELKNSHRTLKDVPLKSYENAKPRILIGLKHINLITPYKTKETKEGLVVGKTKLGWVVGGPKSGSDVNAFTMTICECNEEAKSLHDQVKEYFTTEHFGTQPAKQQIESHEDKRAREVIDRSFKKVGPRYQMGLLWKSDDIVLPDSYQMAANRFKCLEAKMRKDEPLKNWYYEKLHEYKEKGYIRKLTPEEARVRGPRTWYLPHFVIANKNKDPPKLRLVFDAAAKVGGVSLNSCLLTGPEVKMCVTNVLFMFREGKIAVSADIEEWYLRILVDPADCDALRFVTKENLDQEKYDVWIFLAMIFGSACSSSCAQTAKVRNAEPFKDKHPEAVKAIHDNHFADDYLNSHDSIESAINVGQQVKMIHENAGFNLRSFISNSPEVARALNGISSETTDMSLNLDGDDGTEKVLGLFWDTRNDTLSYRINLKRIDTKLVEMKRAPTKREMLKIVMGLFDPIGLVANYLIRARILLQDVWRSGCDWDEHVSNKIRERWESWMAELTCVETIKQPRCYSLAFTSCTELQLHTFVDASEKAFSAVSYWRIESGGGVEVSIITSKARVAPTKMLSIPRLELQAAVLGCRMVKLILENHRHKPIKRYFWSDSRTVLGWIKSDHRIYKTFVANRISEILDNSDMNEWHWISTTQNVADEATKWNGERIDGTQSRWFQGPDFLRKPFNEWPLHEEKSTQTIESPQEELRSNCVFTILETERSFSAIEEKYFSDFRRLVRCYAYVLRYLSVQFQKKKFEPFLTVEELRAAECMLVRKAQSEAFNEEYELLMAGSPVSSKSCLHNLSPKFVNYAIRLDGRINRTSCVKDDTKQPMILPNKHYITDLIVKHYHDKFHHQGQEAIIAAIRQRFWILSIRTAVKRVKSNCQRCKNAGARPVAPMMAPLPACRVQPYVKPFTFTGVDCFGPLNVAVRRSREKRYGVLFVCMTSRAIHIELAADLSTDAFILCLRNFVNRRGKVAEIYCDNGTNFRGAANELARELEKMSPELAERAAEFDIKFIFNPPSSPHFGGAWERLIQSVKKALEVILKEHAPRLETLRSALIEAEHTVNSRPLTHVPIACYEEEALTPNHLLGLLAGGISAPAEIDERIKCERVQWKVSQHLSNQFWKQWVRSYLPLLTRRSKWHDKCKPIEVGDVVLIIDDQAPRNQWVKGIVGEVRLAEDGQVRSALVRTTGRDLVRPAVKLAVLDVIDGNETQVPLRGVECYRRKPAPLTTHP